MLYKKGIFAKYLLPFIICLLDWMLNCKNEKASNSYEFKAFRGSERIRTAVGAFAELSLATRPRNQNQALGSIQK